MASISDVGSNGHHKFTLNVNETYVSESVSNYSRVTWSFVLSPVGNGWDWDYTTTVPVVYSITINGQTFDGNIMEYDGSSTVTIRSGTIEVPHDSDGNKTITFSFGVSSISGSYLPGSASASGSLKLTKIPQFPTAAQSLGSKTETTVTMKWSSDSVIDYLWYSTNNGSTWKGVNVADGKSGTYTISGLSANTKYNIKTRLRGKESQMSTDTSALAVTTYAYPYANKMPNFTIGDSVTIGIYNPLGRSITVNMMGADGSQISNNTITGTSLSGFNNSTLQSRLYASIPNAKSGKYSIKVTYGSVVTTKAGGTYTINEANCKPSISAVSYQDTNTTTTGVTGNDKQIIQGLSTVRYTASGLAVKNSATIASVKVAVNGSTYNMTVSGTTATGGNAAIDSAMNVTATVTLTDSRGLTATKSVTVTMLAWSLPTAIITLEREDNFYSKTFITVDADYAYINGKNTVTIRYRYKKTSASSYSSWATLSDNVQSSFTADNDYDWNVQVQVTDKFGTTTYNLVLQKGMPIIYFDRIKSSVGINCFPVNASSLEVNGYDLSHDEAECTIAAGWANYTSGDNPKVRKSGGVVSFSWACKPTAATTLNATQVPVCTIPEGFRPSDMVYLLCQGTGTSFFYVSINTNGLVQVSRLRDIGSSNGTFTQATTSMWFPISATWVM